MSQTTPHTGDHSAPQTYPARRRRLFWYAATVLFSSACLLVLEIVAARLLAPYVGVSLYTWTAIIGVILAGLSLGNWLGGVWADRGGSESAVGLTLLAAGVASFGILLLLTWVAPLVQVQRLGLLSASFLLVVALFFVPAALLGVVTPLLTTLALQLRLRTGRVVGSLHALAALGSIAGTFLTGYVLIQHFGTRLVVACTALTLIGLGLPFLHGRARSGGAVGAVAILGLLWGTWERGGFANPCERESAYFCIRVVDSSAEAPYGEARSLILDHLLHSTNHRGQPRLLIAPYVHLMDELLVDALERSGSAAPRVFFAGGGAYTQPRAMLARFPRAEVVVAEIDPVVTEVARQRLYLDTGSMRIHHTDARFALAGYEGHRFDAVVTDVFKDVAVPYHLVTEEYARLVRRRLRDGGLYALNVVDVFPDARLAKSLVKTLARVFTHVHVYLHEIPQRPQRVTLVVTASDAYRPAEVVQARSGLRRRWLRITEPLLATGTPLDALPVLRDDYAPVERLLGALLVGAAGK